MGVDALPSPRSSCVLDTAPKTLESLPSTFSVFVMRNKKEPVNVLIL